MQFLYFIPDQFTGGRSSLTPKDLQPLGLGHVDIGHGVKCVQSEGPGGRGLLLTPELPPPKTNSVDAAAKPEPPRKTRLQYDPARQAWAAGLRADDGETAKWHVGHWQDGRPTPEDLERKVFVDGFEVPLLETGTWTIPVARSFLGNETIPKRMEIGPDGKTWQKKDLPAFLSLCKHAEEVFDLLYQSVTEGASYTLNWATEISVDALAVNYRVSRYELSLIGAIGTETFFPLFRALCDWDAYLEHLKKESGKNVAASAPPASNSGSEASSPSSPPSAI